MSFLKELYYRFCLKDFIINYSVDPLPNYVAQLLLKYQWKQIHEFEYDCYIYLENHIVVNFWNANKYYSWFSSGEIYIDNHKENGLRWNYARPNTELLYKVKKKLDNERKRIAREKFLE